MPGPKFKMLSKDNRQQYDSKTQSQQPEPYYRQILKRDHADHEQFDAKSFPFEELIPRWKGEQFDAHFMNAATGRVFTNKHHTKGEGTKKRSNFEAFDFAFCLEWTNRNVNGTILRDRCYNQFTVKSGGCCEHPKCEFKEGPNMVYHCLQRGETCNWGMLKDHQASAPEEDEKKSWTYIDWKAHATKLAEEERDQAQGTKDCSRIVPGRMAEFESWWRLEVKKDAKLGGAPAANARGYSLIGTRTDPPKFMSRQAPPIGEGCLQEDDSLPVFSRLTLNDPIAPRAGNTRQHQRFGQDTSNGRADLEAKRMTNQQARGKKTKLAAAAPSGDDKDAFFLRSTKERKPRHTDKNGARIVGA
ncbi:hypothetical protein E8E13_005754 [Curvularia kusanoi]|uniref:Uncharacterized protein n=1 Tax=Curvularia kusanoi TaxID=90978 RepID=A0A9P4W8I6_CURKU|nr:hypothetical protein E8E13_005754 [Curvularia kusanoi]